MEHKPIGQGGSFTSLSVRSVSTVNRVRFEVPLGATTALSDWWKEVCDPSRPLAKRTVEIHQRDDSGRPVKGWRLNGCWPCKFGISPFRSGVSEVVRERCEIVFEGIEEISANRCGLTDANAAAKSGRHAKIPRLELFAMDEMFNGEHLSTNAFWPGSQVKYLDSQERKSYQLFVRDGKLTDSLGNAFDTFLSQTLWSPPGTAICVMDKAGNLFASLEQVKGVFHHSSFLSGGPVAFAGEIEVKDGQLISVSNKSGHYCPPARSIVQMKTHLESQGLDCSQLIIEEWIET